jgi:hypothetical protein
MRQRFLGLFRILPQHLLASLVREKTSCTFSDAEKLLPPLIESLRAAGRNLKSVDGRTPEEIVAQGTGPLLRLKAVSQKGETLTVRKKQIIDYCAAPVLDKPAT